MKKDTIFDGRFTILDMFKLLILGYTAYATYTLVAGVSSTGAIGQYVRPLIAIAIVEGGLLFSEKLESIAKNDDQAFAGQLAHFGSIVLIVFLAVSSVLVELAGVDLLASQVKIWGFVAPLRQVAEGAAGILLALWSGFCLSIALYFNAKDPDIILSREKIKAEGVVARKRLDAYHRSVENTAEDYGNALALQDYNGFTQNLPPDVRNRLVNRVTDNLMNQNRHQLPPPRPQTELMRTMRGGPVDDVEPVDEKFNDSAPIPATPPFIPANKIANKGKDGDGNFPNRRVPPFHAEMHRPVKRRNPNL